MLNCAILRRIIHICQHSHRSTDICWHTLHWDFGLFWCWLNLNRNLLHCDKNIRTKKHCSKRTNIKWMNANNNNRKTTLFICFKLFFISSNISVFMHNCEKYHITPQWKNTYGKRWMNRERVKRTKVCERAANKRKSIYKNLPEAAKC